MTALKSGDRVRWRHDCLAGNCRYDTGGTVWVPNDDLLDAHGDTYAAAKALGLTADPPPTTGRPFVMVAWDSRRGALQVHYLDELELVEERQRQ
jgi:hypothetical protein